MLEINDVVLYCIVLYCIVLQYSTCPWTKLGHYTTSTDQTIKLCLHDIHLQSFDQQSCSPVHQLVSLVVASRTRSSAYSFSFPSQTLPSSQHQSQWKTAKDSVLSTAAAQLSPHNFCCHQLMFLCSYHGALSIATSQRHHRLYQPVHTPDFFKVHLITSLGTLSNALYRLTKSNIQ